MSTDTARCVVCGKSMTPGGRKGSFQCSNPQCPSGGKFRSCPFCASPSLVVYSEEKGATCLNPDCRLHQVFIRVCPECKKTTHLSTSQVQVCTNRSCPSHGGAVRRCPVCKHDSLLARGEVSVCSKVDCPSFLRVLVECFACSSPSFDPVAHVCLNPACSQHRVRVLRCPTCNRNSWLETKKSCLNTDCASNRPAPDPDADADPDGDPDDEVSRRLRSLRQDVEHTRRLSRTMVFRARPQAPEETVAPAPTAEAPAPVRPTAGNPSAEPGAPIHQAPARTTGDHLLELYEALRGNFDSASGPGHTPLLLPVGTPGSGKTCFLATLGRLLVHGGPDVHLPVPDVRPRPLNRARMLQGAADSPAPLLHPDTAKVMERRVRDLVFEFAQEVYAHTIEKGLWTTQTPENEAYFLYSQLMKGPRPFATLLTLEASGEHFRAVLEDAVNLGKHLQSDNPFHKIIAHMLNDATGILLLMDPSDPQNEPVYLPLLNVLVHELNLRARNRLVADLQQGLNAGSGGPARRRAARKDPQHAAKAEGERLLARIQADFASQNPEALRAWQSKLLPLIDVLDRKFPGSEIRERTLAALEESDYSDHTVRETWRQILLVIQKLPELLVLERGPSQGPAEQATTGQSMENLLTRRLFELGYPPERASWFDIQGSGNADYFPRLTHLALVLTKADVVPRIYPPDRFPQHKLPACAHLLERIGFYLEILGGGLRCYNTSVTGYSVLMDARYLPGPENTLCPINVLEPVFGMLAPEEG